MRLTPQVMWALEGSPIMHKPPCPSAGFIWSCVLLHVYTKAVQYAQSGMWHRGVIWAPGGRLAMPLAEAHECSGNQGVLGKIALHALNQNWDVFVHMLLLSDHQFNLQSNGLIWAQTTLSLLTLHLHLSVLIPELNFPIKCNMLPTHLDLLDILCVHLYCLLRKCDERVSTRVVSQGVRRALKREWFVVLCTSELQSVLLILSWNTVVASSTTFGLQTWDWFLDGVTRWQSSVSWLLSISDWLPCSLWQDGCSSHGGSSASSSQSQPCLSTSWSEARTC